MKLAKLTRRIISLVLVGLVLILTTSPFFESSPPIVENESVMETNFDKLITKILNFTYEGKVRLFLKYDELENIPSYVDIIKRYELIPYILIEVNASLVDRLIKEVGYDKVFPDIKVRIFEVNLTQIFSKVGDWFKAGVKYNYIGTYPTLLNETVKLIGANVLWDEGYLGDNVIIAILDTGIAKNHPNLDDLDDDPSTNDPKVILEVSFVPYEDAFDYHGHGTHIANIIAGTGIAGSKGFVTSNGKIVETIIKPYTQKGIAPKALLYNVKVLDKEGWGYLSWVINGMEWSIKHLPDIIYLGFEIPPIFDKPVNPLADIIKVANDAGIIVICSAGNEGPSMFSVSYPGAYPNVITVAACYETKMVTFFSSRGPTRDLIFKPDILAPGFCVISAFNNFNQPKYEGIYYSEYSGSDIAAAVVCGAVALLLNAYPALTPEGVKALLTLSAEKLNNSYHLVNGAGFLRIDKAFKLAKELPSIHFIHTPPLKTIPSKFKVPEILEGKMILWLSYKNESQVKEFNKLIELIEAQNATIHYLDELSEKLNKIYQLNITLESDHPYTYPKYTYIFELPNASSLRVHFTTIILERGDILSIYDMEGNLILTLISNVTDMWTPWILGNKVYITIFDDGDNKTSYGFSIDSINYTVSVEEIMCEYDVIILAQPLSLEHYVNIMGHLYNIYDNELLFRLVVEYNKSLLFIGDELANQYNYFTSKFNITWNLEGVAVGGLSRNIVSHPITTGVENGKTFGYPISKLYFGGPKTSLIVNGSGAFVVAYDPIYPAIVIWENKNISRGRVVVISDDDLLDDSFIDKADNRLLAFNSIAWLCRAYRPLIHDIGVGISYPIAVYNSSKAVLKVIVDNYGDYTELVNINLEISNIVNITFHDLMILPHKSMTLTYSFTPTTGKFTEIFTIKVYVESNSTKSGLEYNIENNYVKANFTVIARKVREGNLPIVVTALPSYIDSFTMPLIVKFPGDFNIINITIISSMNLVNVTVRVTGNASNLVCFIMNNKPLTLHEVYNWNNITSLKIVDNVPKIFLTKEIIANETYSVYGIIGRSIHIPILIKVQDNVTGYYDGFIEVYNASNLVLRIPISLSITKPKAKVLFDDFDQGVITVSGLRYDIDRLWGTSFMGTSLMKWWITLSYLGYDIDSLCQELYNENLDEVSKLLIAPEYRIIYVHDCELLTSKLDFLIELMNYNKSVIILYDELLDRVPNTIWSFNNDELVEIGIIEFVNVTHPLSWNVNNVTYIRGLILQPLINSKTVGIVHDIVNVGKYGPAIISYENVLQSKLVMIGDSSIFDIALEIPDYVYLLLLLKYSYKVEVTNERKFAINLLNYASNDPPTVRIEVGKQVYEPSESVILRLYPNDDFLSKINLYVSVIDPRNVTIFQTSLKNIEPGSVCELNLTLPVNACLGLYLIKVVAYDNITDYGVFTETFLVKAFEISITNATTLDLSGNVKKVFAKGEIVVINITLAIRSDVKGLVLVQFLDPTSAPIHLSIIQTKFRAGDIMCISVSYKVPYDAIEGEYNVHIYVWATLPGLPGWKPLAKEVKCSFEVKSD